MPRPIKCRRVCCMPDNQSFGPLCTSQGEKRQMVMTVDEFEAIRLIDLERFDQQECAERMNVARTTAQAIYNSARAKLAEFLVNGMELSISGGEYVLCDREQPCCGSGNCPKKFVEMAVSKPETKDQTGWNEFIGKR